MASSKKVCGPRLVSAIEHEDIAEIDQVLASKGGRSQAKIKSLLVSEVALADKPADCVDVPLLVAARLKNPAIIKHLVQRYEADINAAYYYTVQGVKRRKTALLSAVQCGHHATAGTILSLGADVVFRDHNGRTALHHAVRRADCAMTRLLLAHGARPTVSDESGDSPLHVAVRIGHVDLCMMLAQCGADLYGRDKDGATAIHLAARFGHAALVKSLVTILEVETDLRVTCYDGRAKAPLHLAAQESNADTVHTLLLWCSASVHLTDSTGDTALHYAVSRPVDTLGLGTRDQSAVVETVRILLGFSVPARSRNSNGETALHLAAKHGLTKAVEVMLTAGCDPTIKDNHGNLPADLANNDDGYIIQILEATATSRSAVNVATSATNQPKVLAGYKYSMIPTFKSMQSPNAKSSPKRVATTTTALNILSKQSTDCESLSSQSHHRQLQQQMQQPNARRLTKRSLTTTLRPIPSSPSKVKQDHNHHQGAGRSTDNSPPPAIESGLVTSLCQNGTCSKGTSVIDSKKSLLQLMQGFLNGDKNMAPTGSGSDISTAGKRRTAVGRVGTPRNETTVTRSSRSSGVTSTSDRFMAAKSASYIRKPASGDVIKTQSVNISLQSVSSSHNWTQNAKKKSSPRGAGGGVVSTAIRSGKTRLPASAAASASSSKSNFSRRSSAATILLSSATSNHSILDWRENLGSKVYRERSAAGASATSSQNSKTDLSELSTVSSSASLQHKPRNWTDLMLRASRPPVGNNTARKSDVSASGTAPKFKKQQLTVGNKLGPTTRESKRPAVPSAAAAAAARRKPHQKTSPRSATPNSRAAGKKLCKDVKRHQKLPTGGRGGAACGPEVMSSLNATPPSLMSPSTITPTRSWSLSGSQSYTTVSGSRSFSCSRNHVQCPIGIGKIDRESSNVSSVLSAAAAAVAAAAAAVAHQSQSRGSVGSIAAASADRFDACSTRSRDVWKPAGPPRKAAPKSADLKRPAAKHQQQQQQQQKQCLGRGAAEKSPKFSAASSLKTSTRGSQ